MRGGKKEHKKKKMEEDIGVNRDYVGMWTCDFYFLHTFSPFSNIFYTKHLFLTWYFLEILFLKSIFADKQHSRHKKFPGHHDCLTHSAASAGGCTGLFLSQIVWAPHWAFMAPGLDFHSIIYVHTPALSYALAKWAMCFQSMSSAFSFS